jgi:hypothetical protein
MSAPRTGLVGLRVRIAFFQAREWITIGFKVLPAPVPAPVGFVIHGHADNLYPLPSLNLTMGNWPNQAMG